MKSIRGSLKSIGDNLRKIDKLFIVLVIIFALFGSLMVFSASNVTAVLGYGYEETYFFKRQFIYVIAGIFAMFFIIILNDKIPKNKLLIGVCLIIYFLLLLSAKFRGENVNGMNGWTSFFGKTFQPSELGKPLLIMFLASYYGNKRYYKNFFSFLIPAIICMFLIVFVAIQPDYGTALIQAGIVAMIVLSLPLNNNILPLLKMICIVTIITLTGILYAKQDYFINKEADSRQESRLAFTKPCSRYNEDSGYQLCNGYIAINNGGLFGSGLGKSTQKYLYLPEAYTDFIFPIIYEELGIFGVIIIFGMYLYILFKILIIARNASDLWGSIIAYGTFSYLFIHIIVNLGGTLGLIPLTGVPLPFLSFGGSFTLSMFVALGLVEKVSINTKKNKYIKDFRKVIGG